MNLKPLIVCLCILTVCSYRQNGIQPTQNMKALPYFMTQLIKFTPQSFGPLISKFDSSHQEYRLDVGLERQVKDIINQNVITTGFSSDFSGCLAYSVKSNITGQGSKVSISLQVLGKSLIGGLTFTLIVVSQPLLMGNIYLAMFELQVQSSQQTKLISLPNIDNYNFYPLIKSVIIESTMVQGSLMESMGFVTVGEKKVTQNSGEFYDLGFRKDQKEQEQNISVTYVVIAINQVESKKTAQFSSLSVLSAWQSVKTDSIHLIPQYFDITSTSNYIYGYSQWPCLKTTSSNLEFTLPSTGLKPSSKFLISTNRFKYILLQMIDYQCPASHPYKYKGDPLCYQCEGDVIMQAEEGEIFNEYQSIHDENGQRIRRNTVGYHFGQDGKNIISVCLKRKQEQQQKLIVEDIQEKSSGNQEQTDNKSSIKQTIIKTLSNLYNYFDRKTKINNLSTENLTSDPNKPIEIRKKNPVEKIK